MASLYKRGHTWWVSYKHQGKRLCQSLGVSDKSSASELLKDFHVLEQSERVFPFAQPSLPLTSVPTVQAWADAFLDFRRFWVVLVTYKYSGEQSICR